VTFWVTTQVIVDSFVGKT